MGNQVEKFLWVMASSRIFYSTTALNGELFAERYRTRFIIFLSHCSVHSSPSFRKLRSDYFFHWSTKDSRFLKKELLPVLKSSTPYGKRILHLVLLRVRHNIPGFLDTVGHVRRVVLCFTPIWLACSESTRGFVSTMSSIVRMATRPLTITKWYSYLYHRTFVSLAAESFAQETCGQEHSDEGMDEGSSEPYTTCQQNLNTALSPQTTYWGIYWCHNYVILLWYSLNVNLPYIPNNLSIL
jgi:hypothetical protein